MSFRETANDLTTKVKLALEVSKSGSEDSDVARTTMRRDELMKSYQKIRNDLRISKAENEHLLDMIVEAFPDMGQDISSCSSSEEYLSPSGDEGSVDASFLKNGKHELLESPTSLGSSHMTKRRRRQGKRDDRNDPKPIEPLPRDADGNLVFPIVVGRGQDQILIHNLGRIKWEPETYHTSRYIWTVGFRSTRVYPSIVTGEPGCTYTSEILEGNGDMPVFQVTPADMPDKPFRATSSSGVWKQILDALTSKGASVKTHASGPQMYGLSNLGVTKAIQELENADKCSKYIMQKWAEPDKSNAVAAMSSGSDSAEE
ncbi:hypothetical protein LPJ78_004249 [Coemansia sp. RSA 989]|nr:hypothetical protein LPJ79_004125 [Coemansia sp. RSA 1821]KAJ1863123.1 hypothetical protein LPJ78_004249 [Coemansia sp. RSA 989]KAJ1871864.1 hypothetical protein LPJ55_003558 [Coemansia sp. RSA 990]KAJ2673758.1 hypothetical protein IWW42_002170 [Coemansia sp. RSA 1085]